jgi:hypothetical protein
MRSPVLLLLAAALVLSACTEESAAPSETHSRPLESAPADDSLAIEQERALKKSGQVPTVRKRVATIDWAQAKQHPAARLDKLGAEQRAKLLDSPVPALLPNRPELFESATITKGEHWYAASLDGEGHDVYVSGTRLETVVPSLALPDDRLDLAQDFRITRNDLIISLSFNAFGAAYVIEVECAKPSTDPRCTEDDYAVELANALVLPEQTATEGGER